MAEIIMSLPQTRKSWIEFLAPSFGLVHSLALQTFGKRIRRWSSLSLSTSQFKNANYHSILLCDIKPSTHPFSSHRINSLFSPLPYSLSSQNSKTQSYLILESKVPIKLFRPGHMYFLLHITLTSPLSWLNQLHNIYIL